VYIDYLKSDYSNFSRCEKENREKRDKKHLENIVIDHITNNASKIVERWWKVSSVNGYIEENDFTKLLKEAENLFCYANYSNSIILVGVAVEELCKQLVIDNKINTSICDQYNRVKVLREKDIIDSSVEKKFNYIRKMRNDNVHYNNKIKDLDETEFQRISLKVLNDFKDCLNILGYFKIANDEGIEERIFSNCKLSFEEFKLRQRNIIFETKNIDAQISTEKKYLQNTSYFEILEIDIETDRYKELTLRDLRSGFPVCVDLTIPEAELLANKKVEIEDIITATIFARVSSAGLSEEWKLLELHDVFRTR